MALGANTDRRATPTRSDTSGAGVNEGPGGGVNEGPGGGVGASLTARTVSATVAVFESRLPSLTV